MFPIRQSEKGFTLVELAVVLMIIGLLIGGILRGQELMENARVTATVQQVKSYFAATNTFLDTYDAMPGDMRNALTRLKNCNADTRCLNGDASGFVGQAILNNGVNINQAGTAAMPQVETTMYWKHLASAGLISGVNLAANPTQASWGGTHPESKINGGYSIFYMRDSGSSVVGDKGTGHNIRLQNSATSSGINEPMPLTPRQLYKIDMKMDDGLGDSGFVTGDHEWDCDPGGVYRNVDDKTCVAYFFMN